MEEFLDCPHNLALNRMTRMLADLTLVGCYDESLMPKKRRDELILESAKSNLRQLGFFGILEELGPSQAMFQRLFNLEFQKSLAEAPHKEKSSLTDAITSAQIEEIKAKNDLDVELYDYARTLFVQRLKDMDIAEGTKGFADVMGDEDDEE